jgi:hypothetical protein
MTPMGSPGQVEPRAQTWRPCCTIQRSGPETCAPQDAYGTSDSLSAPNDGSVSILSFIEIPAQLLRAALVIACTRAPASPCFCLCMISLTLWISVDILRHGSQVDPFTCLSSGEICSSFRSYCTSQLPLERLRGIRGAHSLSQQSNNIHSHRPIRLIIIKLLYTYRIHSSLTSLFGHHQTLHSVAIPATYLTNFATTLLSAATIYLRFSVCNPSNADNDRDGCISDE